MGFLAERKGLIADVMVIAFVICILYTANFVIPADFGRNVLLSLSCYCMTRLVLQHSNLALELLVIALVAVTAAEWVLSVLQLFGLYPSGHRYFQLTGTFFNPGILGGYLSVSASLLFAYSVLGSRMWLVYACRFVAIASVVILPSTQSRAAILAFLACVLLSALRHKKSRAIMRKYWYWIVAVLVLMSASLYLLKQRSADGRMLINRISCNVIKRDGLFVGVASYAGMYGEEQARYFAGLMSDGDSGDDLAWDCIPIRVRMAAEPTAMAFNEYLQICADYGLGLLLLFLMVVVLSVATSCRNQTIWHYGMAAFLVFALFSYPLHILHMQILFSVMLAAGITETRPIHVSASLASLFPVALLLVVDHHYFKDAEELEISQSTLNRIERWHQAGYYDNVVEDCGKILPVFDDNPQFLFAYGHSLNRTGNYAKSDSVLMLGAGISSDPMFWNVMGDNSLALGRYREAEERYKRAFCMVPNRLYPLTLLAKLYHAEGDTLRFLDMAEKIETFVPKIENNTTRQLRSEIGDIYDEYMNTIALRN